MENQSKQITPPSSSPEQDSPYPSKSDTKLPLILVGLLLLLLVGGGAYYLRTQKNSLIPVNQNAQHANRSPIATSEPLLSTDIPPTNSDWKTFTSTSTGITLKYPSHWVTPENTFISEKAFIAGEQDRSKTYNIIEMQKYQTQLYVGYTNSEWFNKINNSTASMSDQREARIKLTSGSVASGEQYVIFTDEPSSTAQGDSFKLAKAYILKNQTIYQLTLDLYDPKGLETFKKIVPTAYIN